MTYRQTVKVTDGTVVIKLPYEFKDKQVVVIVDDMAGVQKDKLSLMQDAARDPMYLADLNDVNDDFKNIDHETL
jgi:hypothetical protein